MSDTVGPGIYANLHPPGNPLSGAMGALGMISAAGQAQNAIVGAQSNAMQFQARQAMGPILQASIGPDGKLDYNKALIGMASNPATAWMAPDFLNQAVTRQQTQADTALKQMDLAQKQFGAYGNAATSLLALGPAVTRGDVISKMAELVGSGLLPSEAALKYASTLPPNGQPLYQHLRQLALQAQGAEKSLSTVYGQIQSTQLGNKVQLSAASSFMGTNTPLVGGAMPIGNTPEQVNKLETVVGPDGQKIPVPRYQVAPMVGAIGDQGAAGGGQGGGMPSGGAPAGGGMPGGGGGGGITPSMATGQPSMGQPSLGSPGPSTPYASSLPPAVEAFKKGLGPIADYAKQLNMQVSSGQQAIQGLDKLNTLADAFKIGPGANWRVSIASALAAAGMPQSQVNAVMGGTKDDALAAAQEYSKLALTSSLSALKSALGDSAPKVAEFEQFFKNFPNLTTRPEAVKSMIGYMHGLIEQKMFEQHAFTQYQQEPNFDPNKWPAIWNEIMAKTHKFKVNDEMGKALLSGKSLTGSP